MGQPLLVRQGELSIPKDEREFHLVLLPTNRIHRMFIVCRMLVVCTHCTVLVMVPGYLT